MIQEAVVHVGVPILVGIGANFVVLVIGAAKVIGDQRLIKSIQEAVLVRLTALEQASAEMDRAAVRLIVQEEVQKLLDLQRSTHRRPTHDH